MWVSEGYSELFQQVADYTPYAGIGARDTPPEITDLMTGIARMLDKRGYVLRSGGAEGADEAFDRGTSGMSMPEIYLPWKGFRGFKMRFSPTDGEWGQAMEIARKHHPAWQNCSEGARKLLARNSFQLLGRDLKHPSKFVICWTKEGKVVGGTGQALRVAETYEIPIYNLGLQEHRELFYGHLGWEH